MNKKHRQKAELRTATGKSRMSLTAWVIRRMCRQRQRRLQENGLAPATVQQRQLKWLLDKAEKTLWGRRLGFQSLRGPDDFRKAVPLTDWDDYRSIRQTGGWPSWPESPRFFAQTSGTTGGEKYLPITPDMIRHHRRGGFDVLTIFLSCGGSEKIIEGKHLALGGSTALKRGPDGAWEGDLSGIMARNVPWFLRRRWLPSRGIALMDDWEQKLAAIVRTCAGQDVRSISGIPCWLQLLFEAAGSAWPGLLHLVHGGVAFGPYQKNFARLIGKDVLFQEVYPSSEAFVAIGPPYGIDTVPPPMFLLLDLGVYFEFIPAEETDAGDPRRFGIGEIETGVNYEVVVSTPGGLWAYRLGDVIRFTSVKPPRLVFVGRTGGFISAFGEHVIAEHVERAVCEACRATGAEIVEFTTAPYFPGDALEKACHEYAVEFRRPPDDREGFIRILDETVQSLSADYAAHRRGDFQMGPPKLTMVTEGGFRSWMRDRGQLGGQHKVPHAANDRKVIDSLLSTLAPQQPPCR